MRKFRSTAGGHGSIHQSVANEATDVWRGYAVWSTARTCYRWGQVWQESWSGTDVKRWRGTRVVRFLLSTLLGTCLMCCLLSDCGRPGSTVFNLYRSTWYNSSFVIAHLFDSLTFDVFASCWTVWCLTFCILLNCLMFDWSHVNFFNFVFMRMANVVQARLYHLRIWLDNFNSHPSLGGQPLFRRAFITCPTLSFSSQFTSRGTRHPWPTMCNKATVLDGISGLITLTYLQLVTMFFHYPSFLMTFRLLFCHMHE